MVGVGLAALAGTVLFRLKDRIDSLLKAILSALAAPLLILTGFLVYKDLPTGWELLKNMALPYGGAVFLGILVVGFLLAHQENSHLAQMELQRSEKRLDLALEAANEGIWDWNIKTGQAYFSPRYYTMRGYAPDEFPPTYDSWRQLIHPDDLEAIEEVVQLALGEHRSFSIEFRMKDKSGEWRWLLSRGKAIEMNPQGRSIRMVGSHSDINERNQLLHDIGRLVKIGGWKFDPNTGKATSTDEVARICDFDSLEDVSVERGLSCYHGENRRMMEYAFKEAVTHGTPYDLELEIMSAKGVPKWVRNTARPILKDGRVVLVQGPIQDITETKLNERLVQEKESYYRTLFENTGTAMVIIGSNSIIRQCNAQFTALSGFPREAIEGKMQWQDFVDPVDLERLQRSYTQRSIDGCEASREYDFIFLARGGIRKHVHLVVTVLPGTKERICSLQSDATYTGPGGAAGKRGAL